MDYEYLQNVLGSPYVNEGAFNRLKAKGAQAMGALGATAGYQIQNPAETKLRSLWDGFMASLKKTMNDWQTQVSPMIGPDVKIPKGGKPIKNSLDRLAQILVPYTPTKVNESKLKTLTQEGLWDMAKRDMGLNKALASNNPLVILDAYKNHVLVLFQKFMKDAVKSTKLPVKQIYTTLAKMQPKERGWQAAGNMQRVVQQLQKLQAVSVQKSPAASNNPVLSPDGPQAASLPSTSTPSIVPPSTLPPNAIAPTSSPIAATEPTSTPPSAKTQSMGEEPKEGEFTIPPQDMPYVIIKTLEVIVDAVKKDEAHALGLFGVHPNTKQSIPIPTLSTQWGSGPHVTSSLQENDGDASSDDGGESDIDVPNDYNKEYSGQFIYNFRSRFNKYPGQPFTINVPTDNPQIDGVPGATIAVWWYNEAAKNQVYATETKNGVKSKPSMIISYYDHEVNPKMGATTAGHINQFSIAKAVKDANPYGASQLNNAPPEVLQKIKSLEDQTLRALLAISHRKGMEFKSKAGAKNKANSKALQDASTADITNDGTLTYVDTDSDEHIKKSQDELKSILKGPPEEAYHMRILLQSRGYFDIFTDMPVPPQETNIWKDAVMTLEALKFKKSDADKAISNVWMAIKEKNPMASIWPEDATVNVSNLAKPAIALLSNKKSDTIINKNAPVATDTLPAASSEPTEPSVVSAPASKPAAEPPKENPVSSPVSGGVSSPVSGDVSAPVSKPKKKSKKESGVTVTLKGDELVWTKADPNSKPDVVKVSDFMEKLKLNPQYLVALKSNPTLYAKFKEKLESGGKVTEYINPFRKENFL